mmetsp:Transcript_34985/g.99157  ORF Transcript_34985/g.99157 Transcript_34985/m.99157 type:complete len:151 (-) Transcript_34985:484-936(-)
MAAFNGTRTVAPLAVVLGLITTGVVNGGILGGFYTDPNHYEAGSWAGTRMISALQGDAPSSTITLIGSDDGVAFWTLTGSWADEVQGKLVVDFSPKGGPHDLNGTFSCYITAGLAESGSIAGQDCRITWQDGNFWSKLADPPAGQAPCQC